jgi:RHS repeat-associated protein
MNSSVLIPAFDLGKDGAGAGGTSTYGLYHSKIPSDIVSYTLGYYKGDYTAISSGLNSLESAYFTNGAAPTESAFSSQSPSLYNGNIRNLTTSIQGFTTLGTSYQYDQLHRLKQATSYEMTSPFTNAWQGIAATQKYFNSYSYDKNGNITNLVRKDQSGALMDQFTYGYGTTSNRLLNVADAAGITSNTDDIEPGQVANNYQYDLLGQLIKDIQEGIVYYDWRLSDRKLRSITGSGTDPDVNFIYNPFGQRVVKIVKPRYNGIVLSQSNWKYTYYSYDANGQVMAVYECKLDATNATLNKATLKEQHLYGSQRLGMVNKNTLLYQSNTAYTAISPLVQNTYGNTNYELTNHLGNVNAVITDRRFWNTNTLKFEAGVESINDYYPFGMAMKERQLNPVYRYGYNGMEVDNEVFGNGNSYTTEFRQYDPRLGRWKSLDPLMAQFPWQSPYCAFDNNPVFYNDPLGLAAEGGPEKEGTSECDGDKIPTSTDPNKPKDLGEVKFTHKLTPEERKKIESNKNKSFINNNSSQTYNLVNFSINKALKNNGLGYHSTSNEKYKVEKYNQKIKETELFFSKYKNQFQDNTQMHSGSCSACDGFWQGFIGFGLGGTTQATGRVFWSGGEIAKDAAFQYAKSTGGVTLEMTTKGKILESLTQVTSYTLTKPLWKQASKSFAKNASGNVIFVTTKSGAKSTSIWLTIEKPLLEKAKNGITTIIKP